MKKSKTIEYYVCDQCSKDTSSIVHCSSCNIDLCRTCYSSPPVGNFLLCNKCNTNEVKEACNRFQEEWNALMKIHDSAGSDVFNKHEIKLKEIITREN